MNVAEANLLAAEQKAWDLRCKCWTQAQIAEELKMTQSGVSRLLQRVEKRALKNAKR